MNTQFLAKPIQNPTQSPYLDWIKSGKKRFEGRLRPKILEWKLSIGKQMVFFDPKQPDSWVLVKITQLLTYPDFGIAFDHLGSQLIPDRTRQQVVDLYNQLFHYPDEHFVENYPSQMIQDQGVVTIGFEIEEVSPHPVR